MNRALGYTLTALLLGLDLVVGTFLLSSGNAQVPTDDASAWLRVFTRAFELVKQDYVDPKKVTSSQLVHASLRQMLSQLDPHSGYLEAEDYEDFQEENRGEVTGLGIVVAEINSQLTVV
jgi:carboxyl-terminal processing protease